jgi:hypothetical protein
VICREKKGHDFVNEFGLWLYLCMSVESEGGRGKGARIIRVMTISLAFVSPNCVLYGAENSEY